MEEGVVYEATISSENTEDRLYVGSTLSSLKARISNHACDFRLKKREHATTMSSYVWGLKEQGEEPKDLGTNSSLGEVCKGFLSRSSS